MTTATRSGISPLKVVLAQRDFVEFMKYCYLRGDDPMDPRPKLMETWDYQVERAESWQSGQSEIVLKARQLGFSWLLAAYMLWRGSYWRWAIGYWSIDELAAVHELEERVLYIWDRLPKELQVPYRRRDRKVWFESGGAIDAHAATQTGGVSYTYQLVVFDEMAFHREGKANWSAVQPTVSAGGQAIVNSTANPDIGPSGFYYDLWRKSEDGKTNLKPVFIPWSARPGRDMFWLERQKRDHEGSPESFDAYYPMSAGAAFVGRSGLVYPMFTPEWHVRGSDPVSWMEYDIRVAGIDPGGGDPTALVVLGCWRDGKRGDYVFHQPANGEMYRKGHVSVEEMVNWLSRWPRLNGVYVDTAGGSVLLESLKQHGFKAFPATRDRGFGLGFYATLLNSRRLTHHETCEASIAEYSSYRWSEKMNPTDKGRYKTSTPVGEHADCKDATRYALTGVARTLYRKGAYSRSSNTAKIEWS